ncbi:hypothetical protein FRX31_024770 [Thalictrum thalictroides]|uniref:Uncharacterized protein n=1 Tax=Thalictrum thalictroides TaxID=46969 RepID=A0A7J6VL52_THATH|nr:hypothetical protein FRX31_024770 [Thalictrum thalictroides]
MRQTGGVETLDSGPIFDTFGVDKRGRVLCVGPISRKALLASSFEREMLEEVDLERDGWRKEMNVLHENNEKIVSQLNKLVEGLKSGKYNQVPSQHTPSHDSQNNASSNNFGFPSYSQLSHISCAILSHTGVVVAYGTKTPIGTERVVNGHRMQPREAKVLIDEVKDRSYSVWGGEQDGAMTLGEVSRGSYLYWHDDFLPPVDN